MTSQTTETAALLARITATPGLCGGRACIRNLRIRVVDILELLAAGLSPAEVVIELPDLEPDDVRAALVYAARRLNHPTLFT
ncbi:MAG: DUF433 domain-containing protein [Planctomycetota bacterium]